MPSYRNPSKNTSRELTPLQYNFVSHYTRNGFKAKDAALRAGYTLKSATYYSSVIVRLPYVRKKIEQQMKRNDQRVSKDYDWKMNKLKRIINEFIPDDGILNPNEVKVGIAALTELNKMHGDYAPDKRLNLNVKATMDKLVEAKKVYEEY